MPLAYRGLRVLRRKSTFIHGAEGDGRDIDELRSCLAPRRSRRHS